jgi:hypothetical protein
MARFYLSSLAGLIFALFRACFINPIWKPLFPLKGRATECTNFPTVPGACATGNLVDLEMSVVQAADFVAAGVEAVREAASDNCVPPLVYARLSRGGKATFLKLLFHALKDRYRLVPILIRLGDGFMRGVNESQLDALIRQVSNQLTDANPQDPFSHTYSATWLLEHIEKTSGGASVVLMVDRLDGLSGGHADPAVTDFLVSNFLDRDKRYLVYTTTAIFGLDETLFDRGARTPRAYRTVRQPFSVDLEALRAMSPECAAITPTEVALCGGIPSLLYAANTNPAERPAITFASQQLAVAVPAEEQNRVLGEFIREVLIGWARHPGVRRFDRFASMPEVGRVSWHICYIRSILGMFTALDDIPLYPSDLEVGADTAAGRSQCGVDWPLVVQTAVCTRR